jgi:hypothetical protein
MRLKARGLAKHGGLLGWPEAIDPAGVIFYTMAGHTACLFRIVPVSLTGAAQMLADGISSCCFIVNVHIHLP